MYQILEKERLSETVYRFVIEAPYIAPKRKAGNFVILRTAATGERIPITLVDSDPAAGTVTLIVQAIGKTTKQLCAMKTGESLSDMVGPLGKPTPILSGKNLICIGGGVGTAELLPIVRSLRAAGNRIQSIVGARTKGLIILEQEIASVSDSLVVTTDDGTYGTQGLVVDPLREYLTGAETIDAVYAIGPLPMMRAAAEATRPFEVSTFVSLNALMVDGTGMCGGCRVTVAGKMKFACVDGPEFDAHNVDFDELITRNRGYVEFEREADRRYAEHLAKQNESSTCAAVTA